MSVSRVGPRDVVFQKEPESWVCLKMSSCKGVIPVLLMSLPSRHSVLDGNFVFGGSKRYSEMDISGNSSLLRRNSPLIGQNILFR